MDPNQRSSWHPAIWKATGDPVAGWPRGGLPRDHVELDFIEFYQWRTGEVRWHSQAIAWQDGDGDTFQHSSWSGDFLDTFWNTHGLEYNPDYIQLWDFNEQSQEWSPRGGRVTISDAPTDRETNNINRDLAREGPWVLSNFDFFDRTNDVWEPFHGRLINENDNLLLSDSDFQIDHFRFFPMSRPSDADYNRDGVVNAADYTVWRDLYGDLGPDLVADGRGPGGAGPDGVVDSVDYGLWAGNYGRRGSVQLSVPEPSGSLLGVLLLAIVRSRSRPEVYR